MIFISLYIYIHTYIYIRIYNLDTVLSRKSSIDNHDSPSATKNMIIRNASFKLQKQLSIRGSCKNEGRSTFIHTPICEMPNNGDILIVDDSGLNRYLYVYMYVFIYTYIYIYVYMYMCIYEIF
jgi:hypothetical protein